VGTWNGTGNHWGTGKLGSAAGQFNGSNDWVQLLHSSAQNTLPLSLTAWLKPTIRGFDYAWPIFAKYPNGSVNGYSFSVTVKATTGDVILTPIYYSTFANFLTGASDQFAFGSNWTHFAVVYSTSGMSLYVNGALNKTISWTGTAGGVTQTTAPRIGTDVDHSTTNAGGLLDDVRIYNRALSAAEVQAIYNATK
jgi:hypothetical protein